MVTEIVQMKIKSGMEARFEEAVGKAVAVFKRSKGCNGLELTRCIEDPALYIMFVQWDTLENHTEDFRGSDNFNEWRGLVGDCFDAPPEVVHVNSVLKGF